MRSCHYQAQSIGSLLPDRFAQYCPIRWPVVVDLFDCCHLKSDTFVQFVLALLLSNKCQISCVPSTSTGTRHKTYVHRCHIPSSSKLSTLAAKTREFDRWYLTALVVVLPIRHAIHIHTPVHTAPNQVDAPRLSQRQLARRSMWCLVSSMKFASVASDVKQSFDRILQEPIATKPATTG